MTTSDLSPKALESLTSVQSLWPKTWELRAIVLLMQNYNMIYLATMSLACPTEMGRGLAKRAVSKMIKRESKKYEES